MTKIIYIAHFQYFMFFYMINKNLHIVFFLFNQIMTEKLFSKFFINGK
jgi:hypothetical protein